jgi:hypothetical protein
MRSRKCLKPSFARAELWLLAGLLLVAGFPPHSVASRDKPSLAGPQSTAVEARGMGMAAQVRSTGSDPAPTVTSITPDSGANNGAVQITDLSGSYFQSGATVKLTKTSQPEILGAGVSVVSSSTITCTFDLTGVVTGTWDVVVTNPDAQGGTLTDGFTVRAPSHVYLPSVIRYWPRIRDTTVIQAYPTVNAGHAVDMWVGFDHCTDPPAEITRSLVRVDLSDVPVDADIVQASLHLYLKDSCDPEPRTHHQVTVYRATGPWEEMSVTWNTRPGFAEAYGSTSIPSDISGWYSFDVTNLAQAWVSGGFHNYGMVIRGPESSGDDSARLVFATRESLLSPYLEMTYAANGSTPSGMRVPGATPSPEAAPSGPTVRELLSFFQGNSEPGMPGSVEWAEGTSD